MSTSSCVLVLGGARSGKSHFAEQWAAAMAPDQAVLYVATATASDAEMAERITRHQQERPTGWRTLEAPYDLTSGMIDTWHEQPFRVILVDCLTLWASNALLAESESPTPVSESVLQQKLYQALDQLLQVAATLNCHMIIVSNEVGLGLVPPYPLGRRYRDLLGYLNQYLAQRADQVYLLVAGLPIDLKALPLTRLPSLIEDSGDP